MTFVCEMCKINQNIHSLKKIKETEDIIFYYTCPSESISNESEGMVNHFNGVLNETKEKNWTWVVDMKDFRLKDFNKVLGGIEIAKLINKKYGKNLEQIIIINQNLYTETIYNIIKPIFNERLRSVIFFSNNETKNKIEKYLQDFR